MYTKHGRYSKQVDLHMIIRLAAIAIIITILGIVCLFQVFAATGNEEILASTEEVNIEKCNFYIKAYKKFVKLWLFYLFTNQRLHDII